MQEAITSLPITWKLVTVDDIGLVVSGGTPSTKEPEFWGGDIPWITPADLSNFTEVFISKGQRNITKLGLQNSGATLLPENSILFSCRAPIGYVAVAKNPLATNQGFKSVVLFADVRPKYVYYYFKAIKPLAQKLASGTTFLELSTAKFKQLPFPFAPIEEQIRIVDRIEEVFSDLDKNYESLLKSKHDLENYWQLSLNDIFNNAEQFIRLGDVAEIGGGKRLPLGKNYSPVKTNFPYLRVVDFEDSTVDTRNLKYIDKETYLQLENYSIEPNNIYISIAGTIGLVGVVPSTLKNAVLTENAAKITITGSFINNYVTYFLVSRKGQEQIKQFVNSTTQPKLALYKIKELSIPYYPLEIQNDICTKLDEIKSNCQQLGDAINKSIKDIDLIRFKTLEDAFKGDISQQLPSDTSVDSSLLKIQAEKQTIMQRLISDSKKITRLEPPKVNLYDVIRQKFSEDSFSYFELAETLRLSNDKLNFEFDSLQKKNKIVKFFDEQSNTIKYKLA